MSLVVLDHRQSVSSQLAQLTLWLVAAAAHNRHKYCTVPTPCQRTRSDVRAFGVFGRAGQDWCQNLMPSHFQKQKNVFVVISETVLLPHNGRDQSIFSARISPESETSFSRHCRCHGFSDCAGLTGLVLPRVAVHCCSSLPWKKKKHRDVVTREPRARRAARQLTSSSLLPNARDRCILRHFPLEVPLNSCYILRSCE